MDFLPILQFRTACINVLKTPNTNDIIIFNIQQQIKSTQVKQEAQLMLTNPRDAFRSESRPPNTVMFHNVRYSFHCCNSNFVFKTRRFSDIRLHKMS